MTVQAAPLLIEVNGSSPTIADDAWIAPGATLIGAVTLKGQASVWFGAVLRADGDTITVGERSNIQDGTVMHTDPGFPLTVGNGVSVGHGAVLHGCTISDDVLVGMGAIVLNGARVGRGSLVAAGAVVLEGVAVPPGSLVAGVPGKVRRPLGDDEIERVRDNAHVYVRLGQQYREQLQT